MCLVGVDVTSVTNDVADDAASKTALCTVEATAEMSVSSDIR